MRLTIAIIMLAGAVMAGDLGTTDTTAYRGDWGLYASNTAYSASTNAEAARVLGTAALPKTFTNAAAVTKLRITGGSPAVGAVFVVTNANGSGTLQPLVAFQGVSSVNLILTNSVSRRVFAPEVFDYGNAWDGSTFVAPVKGLYEFNVKLLCQKNTGTAVFDYLIISSKSGAVTTRQSGDYKSGNVDGTLYAVSFPLVLTNNQPVEIWAAGSPAATNKLTAPYSYIEGKLVRQLP